MVGLGLFLFVLFCFLLYTQRVRQDELTEAFSKAKNLGSGTSSKKRRKN